MSIRIAVSLCVLFSLSYVATAQVDAVAGVKWQKGPSVASLGNTAQVRIPEGYIFADAKDTRHLMELMQNPTSGDELGFVAPGDLSWFIVFEFDKVGYVRDDEKNSLDASAMLSSIKRGTEASNKERVRRGWPTMTILGWQQPPRYNPTTHNLEWAIKGESQGEPVINYNTRLLGRSGVMRVTLVTDPGLLTSTLPNFSSLLAGFDFKSGQKYAEYRQGDKMAEYGLSALVVGGATAVAVKSGAFKWLWKVIVVSFLAVASFFKKLFSRNR